MCSAAIERERGEENRLLPEQWAEETAVFWRRTKDCFAGLCSCW